MEPRLLKPAQVAELLQVSERKVLRMLQHDQLPGLRVGRSLRVDRERLDQWIDDAAHSGGDG